jgi:hypothetical protein
MAVFMGVAPSVFLSPMRPAIERVAARMAEAQPARMVRLAPTHDHGPSQRGVGPVSLESVKTGSAPVSWGQAPISQTPIPGR